MYFVRADVADGVRTDAFYILNSLDVERGAIRASATIPVIAQRSVLTQPGTDDIATAWGTGVADPIFRVDATVWRATGRRTTVRLSGSVKVPLGRVEDGYSSGRTDYAVGASWSHTRGRHSLMTDVTYWVIGDPPDVDVRNVASFYLGYGRILDRSFRTSIVVSGGLTPSIVAGLPSSGQVGVGWLRAIGPSALGVSANVGVTEGAADLALGTTWRVTF